jgi:hypothetical protein
MLSIRPETLLVRPFLCGLQTRSSICRPPGLECLPSPSSNHHHRTWVSLILSWTPIFLGYTASPFVSWTRPQRDRDIVWASCLFSYRWLSMPLLLGWYASIRAFLTNLSRYTSFVGTPDQSLRMGLEHALQARCMVDVDRPSIEGLQALLLLSQAFFAHNLGKKAYMTFGMAPRPCRS